jgi:biopolymer transport protein ExbD
MISKGMNRSHEPEDDVALVPFVDVALLVVVATVVA